MRRLRMVRTPESIRVMEFDSTASLQTQMFTIKQNVKCVIDAIKKINKERPKLLAPMSQFSAFFDAVEAGLSGHEVINASAALRLFIDEFVKRQRGELERTSED